jgi:hypothetical protein
MPLTNFLQQCIENAGGAAERGSSGLLEALLPPELEPVAGGKSLVTLAVEPQAAESEPGALLAIVGSPILDAFIAFATGRGTVARGYLGGGSLRRKNLFQEVERSLVFTRCRLRPIDRDPEILWCRTVLFHFKVSFLSDERRERLYQIAVNLWSNRPNFALAEHLPDLAISDEQKEVWPEAPACPNPEAFETAVRALSEVVQEESDRHQARIRKRFAVEIGRISDYYERMVGELEHRQRREQESGASKAATTADKIKATQREKESKLRELGNKYQLRLRAQVTAARVLLQPKTFFDIHVDRGQHTRTLTLAYDSLLERLEPPGCDRCGKETNRIHASATGDLLCPVCEGG